MVDPDGMDFGSRVLDAQAAFPLSTEFRLARLFKQTKTVNRYSKNSYKKNMLEKLQDSTLSSLLTKTFH